ncbi:MAG: S-methyl-5'-thioadenosine phosphorylase [Myxococcota bacterium]
MYLGVIGGSGFYKIKELKIKDERQIWTPFGKPSSPLYFGKINGLDLVFLARHGQGHVVPPHQLNYRANIWALKSVGVTHILSVSAVGSLKKNIPPGDMVLIDQIIDATRRRHLTFYDDLAVHVSLADPICMDLANITAHAAKTLKVKIHQGGTYVCIDGPQFSTRAESIMFKNGGASVIGMTNATEARLAREAELHFCTLAMVTDFDCWLEEEENVSVAAVVKTMEQNSQNAAAILANLCIQISQKRLTPSCDHCSNSLDHAVMTSFQTLSKNQKEKYQLLLENYPGFNDE